MVHSSGGPEHSQSLPIFLIPENEISFGEQPFHRCVQPYWTLMSKFPAFFWSRCGHLVVKWTLSMTSKERRGLGFVRHLLSLFRHSHSHRPWLFCPLSWFPACPALPLLSGAPPGPWNKFRFCLSWPELIFIIIIISFARNSNSFKIF